MLNGKHQLFFFFFFLVFASLPSSRQDDRYHSFDCERSNKEETGRAQLKHWQSTGSARLPLPKVIR